MIYPMNIFSSDPTSHNVRPFIIFIAYKPMINVAMSQNWSTAFNFFLPVGGFVLPFPDTGMIDTQSNTFTQNHPFGSKVADSMKGTLGDSISMLAGVVPDPMMTNIYQGTTPRKWSGTWQIIPQSLGEAALVFLLIKNLKTYAAPDKASIMSDKLGVLEQPYVLGLTFSNPVIELAMSFNKMAIESYSINYFAQGYPSTYKDMMPKHIELTLNLSEFGIKTRSDWSLFGGII